MRLKLSSRITEAINLTVLRGIYTHTHTHTPTHNAVSILSRSDGRTDEGSIFCSTQRNAYSVSDILSCPPPPPSSLVPQFFYVRYKCISGVYSPQSEVSNFQHHTKPCSKCSILHTYDKSTRHKHYIPINICCTLFYYNDSTQDTSLLQACSTGRRCPL